jgi:hypothetical protein
MGGQCYGPGETSCAFFTNWEVMKWHVSQKGVNGMSLTFMTPTENAGGSQCRKALQKKATEKLREVEDQLRRGIYLPDKKIPTFKQVAKDWIDYKKPNIRHSTWSVYERHTRNHFEEFNLI